MASSHSRRPLQQQPATRVAAGAPRGAASARGAAATPRWQERLFRLPCSQMGLIAGLLLFAVGTPPFLYAWASTPSDRVYTGLMFDVPDHAQYWSWVTASRGGLFIANTMTPEPNAPIFFNPMMWTLSHVQRLTGLSFAGLFQLWRLLACVVLGVALVKGFRVLVPDRRERAAAYVLAIAGAGLGWTLVVAKYAGGLTDVPFPHDLFTVEPNTLFASYAYPYLALAQGLVLLTFLGAWLIHRDGQPQGYVLGVGAAMTLALTHPYDLITIYAVLGLFWLFELARTRRLPTRLTLAGLAIGIGSGPIAVYYRNLTADDPLWQAILAQYANAGVWTPPHLHLVVLMGIPLVMAALALRDALRTRASSSGAAPAAAVFSPPHPPAPLSPSGGERGVLAPALQPGGSRATTNATSGRVDTFIAIWAIVGLGLVYLPVVYQIKLLTAWQFPVAILAAHTWERRVLPRLSSWLSSRRPRLASTLQRRGVVLAVLGLLVVPTNLYLYTWRFTELRRHDRPYYLHHDEVAVLDWLATHAGPADVVMAPLELGQFVPNYGETRTFLAHWAMTNRFFQRRDEASRFFSADASDTFRRQLLDRDGITLVVRLTDANTGAGAGTSWQPRDSLLFEPVFETSRAAIYRYRPAPLSGVGRSGSPGGSRP